MNECGKSHPEREVKCERQQGHSGGHAAGFPEDVSNRPDPEPRYVWGDSDANV